MQFTSPPVIKTRQIFGLTVVTGTPYEIERVRALSGVELSPGDKVTLLPYRYHIHRNPGYPGILKYLEEQDGGARAFKIMTGGESDD